jgi:hypothetical protein
MAGRSSADTTRNSPTVTSSCEPQRISDRLPAMTFRTPRPVARSLGGAPPVGTHRCVANAVGLLATRGAATRHAHDQACERKGQPKVC